MFMILLGNIDPEDESLNDLIFVKVVKKFQVWISLTFLTTLQIVFYIQRASQSPNIFSELLKFVTLKLEILSFVFYKLFYKYLPWIKS